MSAPEAPCAGCGATASTALCACGWADQVEAAMREESFFRAARVLRKLGAGDLRRVVSVLQYRAYERAFRAASVGERPEGEDRG